MEFYLHKNDTETTIDTIKGILEKKFPSYNYVFKKPVFGNRYLKVMKDNFVAVVISINKGKVKTTGWESNAWGRSVRQTMPIVGVLTESKFKEFEKLIGTYLESSFITKNINDGIRKEGSTPFSTEDHSKYMPKG